MTQERWKICREGHRWTREEAERRMRLAPEKIEFVGGVFANDHQRFVVLGMLLENLGIDKVVKFGNLEDWKAALADLEREAQGDPARGQFVIPTERFDSPNYIENRVASVPEQDRGSFRSILRYLYVSDGPMHLPLDRFRAAERYLEKAEILLARWLRTRTDGSEKENYGPNALLTARQARYRCELCCFADVRVLHLDHVRGREQKVFACLCANCHNIKSRQHDWSGKKRYAEQEEQGA